MVLSVSAGWDADARDPPAVREAVPANAPWEPVGSPIEALARPRGDGRGAGGSTRGPPGPGEARGRRQVARRGLRPPRRDRLREGRSLRRADALSGRDRRPCGASTTRGPPATTSSSTRRATKKDWSSAEDMRRQDDLYRLVVWVGHNDTPVVPGGGSCIFLHLRSGPDSTTSGCTAFEPEPMERLLRWLDPAARPVLVQLPDAEYRARAREWGLPEPRPRARDLGLAPGVFPPGPLERDHRRGRRARRPGDARRGRRRPHRRHRRPAARRATSSRRRCRAPSSSATRFGKLAGSTQVRELGTIETPIVLTNTLAVGTAVEAVVAWTLAQPGNEGVRVGQRARGRDERRLLNDIRSPAGAPRARPRGDALGDRRARRRRLRRRGDGHDRPSAGRAASGRRRGGCPSASAATRWASSCRRTSAASSRWTGCRWDASWAATPSPRDATAGSPRARDRADGSCMIVVATDAPLVGPRPRAPRRPRGLRPRAHGLVLQQRQRRLRDRVLDGGGPAGAPRRAEARQPALLPTDSLSPLFQAALEATEEAVLNALLRATTMTGSGRTVEALPVDRLREVLAQYGRESASGLGGGEVERVQQGGVGHPALCAVLRPEADRARPALSRAGPPPGPPSPAGARPRGASRTAAGPAAS